MKSCIEKLLPIISVIILALGLFFIMTNAHPIFERVFKTYDKLNSLTYKRCYYNLKLY